MKRRAWWLGWAALCTPWAAAWAQSRPRLIAALNGAPATAMTDLVEEVRAGLAALGHVEGRGIELQCRVAGLLGAIGLTVSLSLLLRADEVID